VDCFEAIKSHRIRWLFIGYDQSNYFFALAAFTGAATGAGFGVAATATTNFLILCGRTLP
jgi:hypothetical protein